MFCTICRYTVDDALWDDHKLSQTHLDQIAVVNKWKETYCPLCDWDIPKMAWPKHLAHPKHLTKVANHEKKVRKGVREDLMKCEFCTMDVPSREWDSHKRSRTHVENTGIANQDFAVECPLCECDVLRGGWDLHIGGGRHRANERQFFSDHPKGTGSKASFKTPVKGRRSMGDTDDEAEEQSGRRVPCQICRTTFTEGYERHVASEAHLRRLEDINKVEKVECPLCQCDIIRFGWALHASGRQHRGHLERILGSPPKYSTAEPPTAPTPIATHDIDENNFCQICDQDVSSKTWRDHCRGGKHMRRLMAANRSKTVTCPFCDVDVLQGHWAQHAEKDVHIHNASLHSGQRCVVCGENTERNSKHFATSRVCVKQMRAHRTAMEKTHLVECAMCHKHVRRDCWLAHEKSSIHQRNVKDRINARRTACLVCGWKGSDWLIHSRSAQHREAVRLFTSFWCVACDVAVEADRWESHRHLPVHVKLASAVCANNDWCSTCREQIPSGDRRGHERSTWHQQGLTKDGVQIDTALCEVCRYSVPLSLWGEHLKSAPHIGRLPTAGMREDSSPPPVASTSSTPETSSAGGSTTKRCTICFKTVPLADWQSHSKIHEPAPQAHGGSTSRAPMTWCDVCELNFLGPKDVHEQSNSHMKAVTQRAKEPIRILRRGDPIPSGEKGLSQPAAVASVPKRDLHEPTYTADWRATLNGIAPFFAMYLKRTELGLPMELPTTTDDAEDEDPAENTPVDGSDREEDEGEEDERYDFSKDEHAHEYRRDPSAYGAVKNVTQTMRCEFCGQTAGAARLAAPDVVGQREGTLLACGGCEVALYCSRDCQQMDWADHSEVCEYIGKELPPLVRRKSEYRDKYDAEAADDDESEEDYSDAISE